MKKAYRILLALCAALSLALPAAGAAERDRSGWQLTDDRLFRYVRLEDGTAEIVHCNSDARELEVPGSVNGMTVTSIADRAFYDRDSLVRVTLPDSIRSVGPNPFADCGSLEEIIVSADHPYLAVDNGVLYTRPEGRLVTCLQLSAAGRFSIPQSVRSIGSYAFNRCTGLNGVDIPDTVTAVEPYAFYGCYNLSALDIPAGVSEIGTGAFSDCYFLTEVSFAGAGVSIGEYAFGNCVSLTSFDLPERASVCAHAFDRCLRLERVSVPAGATILSGNPFTGCAALKEIILSPDHPSLYLEDGVLFSRPDRTLLAYPCRTGAGEYTVPDGTVQIGDAAFEGLGLTAVRLPETLEDIGGSAFRYCDRLSGVSVPAGTVSIGADAFSDCAVLETVSLPEGLASIGDRAFYRCAALSEINLPDSLFSIGASAFQGCDSLVYLTIPEGVGLIGEQAFYKCPVLTLRIVLGSYTEEYLKTNPGKFVYQPTGNMAWLGEPVTEIPGAAPAEGARTVSSNGFSYILLEDGTAEITDYHKSDPDLSIPSELDGITVTTIADKALEKSALLETVTIPDTVLRVGVNPFSYCEHLKDIIVSPDHPTLVSMNSVLYSKPDKRLVSVPIQFRKGTCSVPEGIRTIGSYAFYYTVGVKKVEIPGTVTSIEEKAFSCTRYLTDITIGEGLTDIGDYAFYYCWSVRNLSLPQTLKTIGVHAFDHCDDLTELILPNHLVSIGECAFLDCDSLRNMNIPESVTFIGKDAFKGCDKLTLTVHEGSFAETWCRQEGVPFTLYGLESGE